MAAVLTGVSAAHAWMPLSSELLDLEARIEYGFYSGEPRSIEGALDRLEQLESDGSAVRYYEALAVYRLAQVQLASVRPDLRAADALVERCVKLTSPIFEDELAGAEAGILGAACSTLSTEAGALGASLTARKIEQIVSRARQRDAENPRLALIEARLRLAAKAGADGRTAARQVLEAAAWALQQREAPAAGPRWGEAEALALLARLYLEDGDVLAARDMIERALLVAPGYRVALALKEQLLSAP